MSDKLFGNLFLSVGAMKAGTTWLYSVLDHHPNLYFTPEKEPHYFYHKYVNGRHLSEARRLAEAKSRYLTRFDPERANIDRVRGNLHWVANYLQSPVDDFWYKNLFSLVRDKISYACDFSNLNAQVPAEAWPQISAQCDALRVIYTMRDPVSRLWSHVKFHMQVTGQLEQLATWDRDDFARFVGLHHIWVNAEYGQVIARLKKGLGAEQYQVLFYEEIHADQGAALRRIEDFVGVPHFQYPPAVLQKRVTQSAAMEMPHFFPDIVSEDVKRIVAEVDAAGYSVPKSWQVPA